jgi:hypothetical protein
MHAVIETADYLADARGTGLAEHERRAIVDFLATNPRSGDLIPGAGGARKLRWARPGRGKSGGYRVITYFGGDDVPVFLLALFSKGDKVNLSPAERNELRDELAGLARDYREGRRKLIRPV